MAQVGRPTELTDEVIHKIEEVAALDGSVEEMAFYANVHRGTVYRWLKENKEFSDRIEALRQDPILKARQTVIKSLDDPNQAFKYLERKRPAEFSPMQKLEHSTPEGRSFNVNITTINNANKLGANQEAGGSMATPDGQDNQ